MQKKLYKKDYLPEINEEKKNIKQDVFHGKKVDRAMLMQLQGMTNNLYQAGQLSRKGYLVIKEAIKELWEDEFNTTLGNLIFGKGNESYDSDDWD